MSQLIRKLRILCNFLVTACGEWRDEVWNHDLDETYCCNGHECGCYGSTRGEVYEAYRNTKGAADGR